MPWEIGVALALIAVALGLLLKGDDAEEESEREPHAHPAPAPAGNEVARRHDDDVEEDGGDDDASIHDTLVGELPHEIRVLHRGYRAASRSVETDEAQIEIAETEVDALMLAELLAEAGEAKAGEELDEGRPPLRIEAAGATDPGRRRAANQDAFVLVPEAHVYAVADGMGGHAGGELASRLCVGAVEAAFRSARFEGERHLLWPRQGDELACSLEMANRTVHTYASRDLDYAGMGTTATALRIVPERRRFFIAHVGDSRCYRVRGGELSRLTRDHTFGEILGARGPLAARLSRAVGTEAVVEVDLEVGEICAGDRYLVCSDGLPRMVPDDEILALLEQGGRPDEQVQRLIDAANDRGGKDNITAIVLHVEA